MGHRKPSQRIGFTQYLNWQPYITPLRDETLIYGHTIGGKWDLERLVILGLTAVRITISSAGLTSSRCSKKGLLLFSRRESMYAYGLR